MNNKNKVILITAMLGVLGAGTAAGASGFTAKVTGLLRGDMKVTVDGQATSMKPVVINGQVYLPARAEAEALGYTLNYNGSKRSISIDKKNEEIPAADQETHLRNTGVIVSVSKTDDNRYKVELLGKGDDRWIMLNVDGDTVIQNSAGSKTAAKDLKAGMKVTAEYGPIVAKSYPGQSHAASLTLGSQTLIREDVIQDVQHTSDGWVVKFGEAKGGTLIATLTVTSGKETSVLTAEGQPVSWEDVKAGEKVRVYYGPNYTDSKMPEGPLFYMVMLDGNSSNGSGTLTEDQVKAFQDLAWKQIASNSTVITAKKDAKVEQIAAKDVSLMTTTETQKKDLENLQATEGQVVTVSFNTKQDTLLGPLVLAFNPETQAFLGYFPRK
ncbi:stalk domain-containing protein [Paenibacillus physcomitrellae]|uniref:Copper amine oxidase-like N-terminal domain-containing protein n=1 Tax=Paenibacillus physcomitrellae TaxID=1619311 RepID=A0ABQ1GRI4_9BACL|nr:stalk domain-containing protein [Paenibacillus physcomitrellae]GGA48970.1 hypothetical protein GCM10010917_37830 [Paenibacillus physcomitrellae]